MNIKNLGKNILHFEFDSQYEVTSTFMRLQEFYENPNPKVRNNYFTLEQFMDIYAKDNENFTYCIDWNGFNVPGDVVVKFYRYFNHTLLTKEAKLFQQIMDKIDIFSSNFYLIGTHNRGDINHEIAHALFHLSSRYRRQMNKITEKLPYKKEFGEILVTAGYDSSVINDEIQAYLSDPIPIINTKHYLTERMSFDSKWVIPKSYQNIYLKYVKKYKIDYEKE